MKPTLIAFTAMAALLMGVQARSWTSADGSKTFEGKVRSYDSAKKTVTVLMSGGKAVTFPVDKLSADDIAYLNEWEAEANKPDPAEVLASTVVGKKVVPFYTMVDTNGEEVASGSSAIFKKAAEVK